MLRCLNIWWVFWVKEIRLLLEEKPPAPSTRPRLSRHVQRGGVDVAHVEPLPGDGLPGEHAIGREPHTLLPVPVVHHFPVGVAFEQEDGLVRVGVVSSVQVPERVVPGLHRWEGVGHLLRVRPEDPVAVDVECKHLQNKEAGLAFLKTPDLEQ